MDEKKKFYKNGTSSQCNKTFSLPLTSMLKCLP
jgi:hypothetical protein